MENGEFVMKNTGGAYGDIKNGGTGSDFFPNIKLTTDGGAAPYMMPYDFMQMAVSISQKELATIEPDKIPAEIHRRYPYPDAAIFSNDIFSQPSAFHSGHGIRIDDGHRPVIHLHKLESHFRNFPDISCHHIQVACQQHQGLAVRSFLYLIYFLHCLRIGRITSDTPYGICRIENNTAFAECLHRICIDIPAVCHISLHFFHCLFH